MIESVQVFDDMSDQAKFTKMDDGSRTKTLNIKLKKDKNKGYFGRALVGYGSDDRYETNLNISKFNGNQRISLLMNANNINKQGFSFSDIISSMGGFSGFGGGGGMSGGGGFGGGAGFGGGMQFSGGRGGFGGGGSTGLIRSFSTGLNYSNQWAGKFKLTGSYFLSNSTTNQEQSSLRTTTYDYLGIDSIVARNIPISASRNTNTNHRFNLRMEYQIDSMNTILYTPSVTFQKSGNVSNDTSFSRATVPTKEFLVGTSRSLRTNDRDGYNYRGEFLYRHKFGKIGRTITLGWNNNSSGSNSDGSVIADNIIYNSDGSISQLFTQNQENHQKIRQQNNTLSGSYTEPMGLNKLLELNYSYTHNVNTSDKATTNFNSASGKYDLPNLPLTNEFENTFNAHRYTFELQGAGKKI
jgi:hypothetical protein